MMKQEITIQIPEGLEARPVALLVQVASQYGSGRRGRRRGDGQHREVFKQQISERTVIVYSNSEYKGTAVIFRQSLFFVRKFVMIKRIIQSGKSDN